MIPEKNIIAIKKICQLLTGVDWRLVGSMNLALQGIKIDVHDIDIVIDIDDIDRVNSILENYCIQPIEVCEVEFISSFYGQYMIEKVYIDIVARAYDEDIKVQVVMAPATIKMIGKTLIPCGSLGAEYEAYKRMGNIKKTELIAKKL